MEKLTDMKLLFTIVNDGFGSEVVRAAREFGAKGATIFNARGTGTSDKSFLGISIEPEKEIVIVLAREEITNNIMEAIDKRTGVTTPASGICFCLPVSSMTLLKGVNKE